MKRKMLQYSPERAEYLDKIVLVGGYPTVKQKMFGHEVHFLNGYMFTGANVDGIFVNIGKEAKESALERETGVSAFTPMEGITMKEYLLIVEPVVSDPDQMKVWLDKSSAYLLSKPFKEKKKKRKKKL